MRLKMVFFTLSLIHCSPLWANPLIKIPAENCVIQTTAFHKTGQIEKNLFQSKQKNKAGCEKVRRTFQTNFSPDQVTKVEATMIWRGGK